jgi:hypothetical protein
MASMSSEERRALVIGAIGRIQEAMIMSPDGANKARNIVKSSALRQKLEILLGPQQADELISRMDDEIEKVATDYAVTGGSPTAGRLADDTSNMEAGFDASLGSLLAGDIPGAARAAAGGVVRNIMPTQMSSGTADDLLKMMGETDPARMEQMIEAALRGMPTDERLVPGMVGGLGAGLAPNPEPDMGYDPYQMRIVITPP